MADEALPEFEMRPELEARIKQAAFEAAYLEMTSPDPASHHFARRVLSTRRDCVRSTLPWVEGSHHRTKVVPGVWDKPRRSGHGGLTPAQGGATISANDQGNPHD